MEPEEDTIKALIRDKTRLAAQTRREKSRLETIDRQRFAIGALESRDSDAEILTEKDVTRLASRMKRRKRADEDDLRKLSLAFLQDSDLCGAFVRITGASNIVVKELTGSDADLQLLAAESLCNLALGDEGCCRKVTTFAAAYLVTFLDNFMNRPLCQTCLWTIQNLAWTDQKSLKTFVSLKLMEKLIALSQQVKDPELLQDYFDTIDVLVTHGWEELPEESRNCLPGLILRHSDLSKGANLYLLHKILLRLEFEIDQELLSDVIGLSLELLSSFPNNKVPEKDDYVKLIVSLRNLKEMYRSGLNPSLILVSSLKRTNSTLSMILNPFFLLENESIVLEVLELCGALSLKAQSDPILAEYLTTTDDFVQNLKIPSKYAS